MGRTLISYCVIGSWTISSQSIILQVSGGSANMEPYACKTVLLSLVNYGLNISTFTTDRSSSIRTMLQNCPEFSKILHEFDPWHWISKFPLDYF